MKDQSKPRILVDQETGEKFEVTEIEGLFSLQPHKERKPIFVDPLGNEVFKGDTIYFALSDGSIQEGKCYSHTTATIETFLRLSDCQKWVNSNIKTLTLKEALELIRNLDSLAPANIIIPGQEHNPYKWVDEHIKEKCL